MSLEPADTKIVAEFKEAVNMTPAKLGAWLETRESKIVGFKDSEGAESVGHQSGKRILELLRKKAGELDEDDLGHMRKVLGYIHRHLAQKPAGDITERNWRSERNWRYSLMNWGHDPMKTVWPRRRTINSPEIFSSSATLSVLRVTSGVGS